MKAITFLGGGRISGALCAGLRQAGYHHELVVYDRHPEKLKALQRESGVVVARDLASAVERAQLLIVAVRPGSIKAMISEVVACGVAPLPVCVSLAAGIPIRNLRTWMPDVRWVRAMPSPVCRMGRGLTAICFDRGVRKSERKRVRWLFEQVGEVPEITERKFDAFTATYSSSHGYHALATLSKAAQDAGLDRNTALLAAAHALANGIAYWRESGLELSELLHEAATPGGIAAATMAAMDRSGYARVVRDGLRAGIRQAQRNGRK